MHRRDRLGRIRDQGCDVCQMRPCGVASRFRDSDQSSKMRAGVCSSDHRLNRREHQIAGRGDDGVGMRQVELIVLLGNALERERHAVQLEQRSDFRAVPLRACAQRSDANVT